jgi:uncharacterized protein (TIGR03083 family)
VPTSLTFDEHLSHLVDSGTRLGELAVVAGLDAAVPTCPGWTTRDLLAHQAMVHRFAAANLAGDPGDFPDAAAILDRVDDLVGYYRDGHAALVTALGDAPPDLLATVFLNDAPAPRDFWARRQAHETTIHMVDALSAALARVPSTAEAAVDGRLAVDGIDELLRGFLTRGRAKLFDGQEFTVAVVPSDSDRRWLLAVGPTLTVADGDGSGADATVAGTSAALYLALWNRGEDVATTGRPDVLGRWRETTRVSWA